MPDEPTRALLEQSRPGLETWPGFRSLPHDRVSWERLEAVFTAAAALPESERSPFLEHECGADTDLRSVAESLLRTDPIACRDLTAVIEGAARSLFLDERMEGTLMGAWRIVREIGRGGMGAVYLAVRDGADFEQRVAVKLVKRGIDTTAVLSRFLDERRILAGLDHPYIARLIDGGTSPDGRPYFIMEFVEGLSIADYCVRERMTTNQRCELFRKVCEPVSYAHGRLVIHRDLKPANIMVTPGGTPKLLDFGIAKLLTAGPGEHTAFDQPRALTPQYASPEQIRGDSVDTATDVYSLGVILRELVAQDRIPADLANIVSMATRPAPERRYRSVEQFSEDVRRYLAGLPVIAREDTWVYRAGRFVVRNRVSMAAGAVAALLLAAGIFSIVWEARQADIQRRKAERRLSQMVELANRALFDVHGSIERLPGSTEARRKIVNSTVDYLDKLRQDSGEDARVLSTLASAYQQVARIEGSPLRPNLGDLSGAEENYLKADKILAGLLASDPRNPALRLRSADLNSDRGELASYTGHDDKALPLYKKGLEDVRASLDADPRDFAARKAQSVLQLRVNILRMSSDPVGIRREDMAQLPLNEALMKEHPEDVDTLLNLATTWTQIGSSFGYEGRLLEQIDSYRKAAVLRERAFAMRPADVAVQRDLLLVYGHIGDGLGCPFMISLGDYRGAIDWYGKAAAIARNMAGGDSSDKQARIDLGVVLMRTGASQTSAGDYRAALPNLDRAARILDSFASGPPLNVSLSQQTALVYEYKARALERLGQADEAAASWRRSLDLCRSVLAVNPADIPCRKQQIVDWNGLAPLLAAAGNSEAAFELARGSLDLARQVAKGPRYTDRAYLPRTLAANGAAYLAFARRPTVSPGQTEINLRAAADYYRRAVREWRALKIPSHPYTDEARQAEIRLEECERALTR